MSEHVDVRSETVNMSPRLAVEISVSADEVASGLSHERQELVDRPVFVSRYRAPLDAIPALENPEERADLFTEPARVPGIQIGDDEDRAEVNRLVREDVLGGRPEGTFELVDSRHGNLLVSLVREMPYTFCAESQAISRSLLCR